MTIDRPYVSVIMPAYNEEKVIENHVTQVADFLEQYLGPDRPFQIIVVDDGSRDSTGQIIDQLASDRPYLLALHHSRNLGRGRGIRTGFASATGWFIFTLDADLSYTPEHIAKMLPPLESGQADLVLASAYHPQGQVKNVPFGRAVTSRLGNKLLSISLGGEFRTVTCVVRGYTREVIDTLVLFSDDKEIHLEIVQKARMLGFRIIEVPAELNWRPVKRTQGKKGLSAANFQDMVSRHLFYNFLFRPSQIMWAPITLLGLLFVLVTAIIADGYLVMLAKQTVDQGWVRYLVTLREHILYAKVSYFVWSFCLLLLFQFVSLVFIAKQNNHHYQEVFSFLSRLNQRLEKLEADK